jgi:hypothetical protein
MKNIPQTGHCHTEPRTYTYNPAHHASFFGNPRHGHQSIVLVLYLPGRIQENIEEYQYGLKN